jgi:hypothetical protein
MVLYTDNVNSGITIIMMNFERMDINISLFFHKNNIFSFKVSEADMQRSDSQV